MVTEEPSGEVWDSLRCAHCPLQVALIVVDISWINLPISQYSYTTLETRRNGAQQLASAAILVTRAGRMARLLNAVALKFALEVGALSSVQQFCAFVPEQQWELRDQCRRLGMVLEAFLGLERTLGRMQRAQDPSR